MKKNILQIITIGLCAVLLVIVIIQGKKLDEISKSLDTKVDNLRYQLQDEVRSITNIVSSKLNEMEQIVLSKELKPIGINKEDKKLLANAVVNLKEWYEDTEVTLYMKIGNEKSQAEMASDGNGVFSAKVELPCEMGEASVIELEALVSGGGLTKKESLGAWGDISMLLPLRSDGAAWSGPTFKNGVMSSQFNISIVGQNSTTASVNNPEFWVYKNGEIAQKVEAIEHTEYFSGSKNFSVHTEYEDWSIKCEAGDNIEIRFHCEDEYGLGYDFPFANWVAVEETNDNTHSAGASQGNIKPFEIYWPE